MKQTFKRNHIFLSVLPLLALGMAGCGSDSDSTARPIVVKEVGYLHSGLLDNVPYRCGAQSGRTGRLGHFIFEVGRPCHFDFGDMRLEATVTDLLDGVVTLYDLTNSQQEAWSLMAIIDALSFGRPGTDQFIIVDQVLTQRLVAVDLAEGDTAFVTGPRP